jgi:hypothetical protein
VRHESLTVEVFVAEINNTNVMKNVNCTWNHKELSGAQLKRRRNFPLYDGARILSCEKHWIRMILTGLK